MTQGDLICNVENYEWQYILCSDWKSNQLEECEL